MESYEKETSLKKEHVGALCSVVVIGNKVENFKKEKVYPFHVTCDGENEHLGKSGALGMCDDPYCTTCPTYFKAYQQSNPKDSTEYDSTVSDTCHTTPKMILNFVWEVVFAISIIGLGLLLFALLIGNIQNFLQGLGRSEALMFLVLGGVTMKMIYFSICRKYKRKYSEALVNLPEDLQIDIRRHLFNFIKKIRVFSLMDEPILDAICERLRQKDIHKWK
ncbi:hypothetical protein P8452_51509 [Trifolium repens]|nr:hypothetical protein P8452_51509 [Trifolium repens]